MQCTKQLKTSAEATSFQLTCKIIVFFCNSWVSFGKEQPKLNCGGQIAKKIMVNELQWLLEMGVSIFFHVMIFQSKVYPPKSHAISPDLASYISLLKLLIYVK